MGGPLQLVFGYSTVNGGARDISPRAFSRSAIRPNIPARKNFITTMTRVANSSVTIVGIELQHVIEACARRSQDVGHVAYDKLCLLRPISRTDHVAVFVERRLTADEQPWVAAQTLAVGSR